MLRLLPHQIKYTLIYELYVYEDNVCNMARRRWVDVRSSHAPIVIADTFQQSFQQYEASKKHSNISCRFVCCESFAFSKGLTAPSLVIKEPAKSELVILVQTPDEDGSNQKRVDNSQGSHLQDEGSG